MQLAQPCLYVQQWLWQGGGSKVLRWILGCKQAMRLQRRLARSRIPREKRLRQTNGRSIFHRKNRRASSGQLPGAAARPNGRRRACQCRIPQFDSCPVRVRCRPLTLDLGRLKVSHTPDRCADHAAPTPKNTGQACCGSSVPTTPTFRCPETEHCGLATHPIDIHLAHSGARHVSDHYCGG